MKATQYILAFMGSFFTCYCLAPVVIKTALRLNLTDKPTTSKGSSRKKMHKNPVPRLGGLVIFFSFLLNFWIWAPGFQSNALILAPAFIFLIGILDDIYSLSAKVRLALEIVGSLWLIYALGLAAPQIMITPGWSITFSGVFGYALGCLVLVGAINSMNMVDGLDGLANGIAFISISILTIVHFLSTGSYALFFLTLPILGASLALLKYNGYPARIFLGDGGSYFLGFMSGLLFLLLMSNQSFVRKNDLIALATIKKQIPFMNILLCFAVPIFDTAHVIIRRLMAKQSPMRPDNRHFHHTLLRLGLNHPQAVGFCYFLSLLAGTCAIVPLFYQHAFFEWLPILAVILLATIIVLPSIYPDNALIDYANRLMKSRVAKEGQSLPLRYFNRTAEFLNISLLYLILLGVPLLSGMLPRELGFYALMAYFLLLATKLMRGKVNDFVPVLILYLSTAVLLVANNVSPLIVNITNTKYNAQDLYNLSFILLFAVTCIYVLLNLDRRLFLVSPSKFLLMAVPILLLLIPDPLKTNYKLNIIALRCLIVFFAIQALVQKRPSTYTKLRFACLTSLAFIALFGIFGLTVHMGK